jgi:hypothetical protein
MNILNLIQRSHITAITYTSINEKLVQQHLDLLDGEVEYLPISEKSMGDIICNDVEFLRDLKLNLILTTKKVFYVLDLSDVKLPDSWKNLNPSPNKVELTQYIRDSIRELSSKLYQLKNENIEISLIILCQLYYSGERYIPKYGDSILYNSELVIQLDNDDISIQKNRITSDQCSNNRIEYLRDFYLKQLI